MRASRPRLRRKPCAAFLKHLPFKSQVVHVRWSGEGVWIPLGERDFGVTYENHTSFPAPGQIILYPAGGISETEILLAYGGVRFASKMGQLAGNHFITITSGTGEPAAARQDRALEGCAGHRVRARLTRYFDTVFSRKFSASAVNACMLSSRSDLPVSSVIEASLRPAIAMQLWPAASP